jgi:hypothetical protein
MNGRREEKKYQFIVFFIFIMVFITRQTMSQRLFFAVAFARKKISMGQKKKLNKLYCHSTNNDSRKIKQSNSNILFFTTFEANTKHFDEQIFNLVIIDFTMSI